jgi:excinuclease ABC subunit A
LPGEEKLTILAPVVRGRKGEYKKDLEKYLRQGFLRARIDGEMVGLDEDIQLDKRKNHTIEVVVDRLVLKPGDTMHHKRLEASIETATKLAGGLVIIAIANGEERLYSQKLACPDCGTSVPVIEPRSFSFNSPYGACATCNGLGSRWVFDPDKVIADPSKPILDGGLGPAASSNTMAGKIADAAWKHQINIDKPWETLSKKHRDILLHGEGRFPGILKLLDTMAPEGGKWREYMEEYQTAVTCPDCQGKRLQAASLAVRVQDVSIDEYTGQSIERALQAARSWRLDSRETKIAGRLVDEIVTRLDYLRAVGLEYLSLNRSAGSLSGGEAQRIRLASQIGAKLRGVLYVLDEPSIGLHPRDNERLIATLEQLRDLGNTVLVVEHDQETIERADYVVDLGPGAGRLGGELVARGTPSEISANPLSVTGQYLSGAREVPTPKTRRAGNGLKLTVAGAREHNLKNVTISIPLGTLTVVTGVSGSGKSTFVNDILYRAVAKHICGSKAEPGAHDRIDGLEHLDKVIEIDQSPIGRTPRSNPATYTGLFTPIRDLFAMLPESRERGYKAGRFSFNVKGGRCEACQGDGLKRIEMNFLPDVYVTCDICRGRRYNRETLQVKYRDKSIADVLESAVDDALPVLENIPQIYPKLKTLADVGLGYVHLGQSSTTLSGGEAQRIKLARELSKRQTGRTLYILDEPTTGLHFEDVARLLDVLQKLVDHGNTVLIIEHQLDIIKAADWLIDLGPEGGEAGGTLVGEGTPEQLMKVKKSHTGQALRKLLRK